MIAFTLLDSWALPAVIGAAAVTLWIRSRRQRAALPIASTRLLEGLPVSMRQRLRRLPVVLQLLAVGAFGLALARPVDREVLPIRSQGIDILLVVDVSSSMAAQDAGDRPGLTRIAAARERAVEFAAERTEDRVGLVTFARFPDLRCPPTLDERALAAFLRSIETVTAGSAEDATAIGAAVAKAAQVLRESEGSRIAILLSDGANNVDTIPPDDASKLAADVGLKIYSIGFGRGSEGFFGRVMEPDFAALQSIADATGGQFFRARTSADLAEVYAEIDRLETRELEDPRYRTHELFDVPLVAGLALLILALAARVGPLREVPS